MMSDSFHQMVSVRLELGNEYSAGEINRVLKAAGATLHYDVYGFERKDKGPAWQSESYIYVALLHDGKSVDAQETVDQIGLEYPMATIGSEYIPKFVETSFSLAASFNVPVKLNDDVVDREGLISYCDKIVTELMEEWGEEPGSETLRILIEKNYGQVKELRTRNRTPRAIGQ